MEMLDTILITLLIVAICIVLLGVKVFFVKGGRFPNGHVSGNKAMRDRGIGCVQSQDREAQRKSRFSIDELEKALNDIAQMKVAVPNMALSVIDRAIQMFGGAGVSDDTPLAKMWAAHRALRLSDGPDEVHREMIARHEIGKFPTTYI